MIKIKYLKLKEDKNIAYYYCYFEYDNTEAFVDVVGNRPQREIMLDVYLIARSKKQLRTEPLPDNLMVYELEQCVPKKMNVNWYSLKGKVYDQYGDILSEEVEFSIDGEVATIENGKIVEKEVEESTSYFIVARYGGLEERQERFLYAPREVEPTETEILGQEMVGLKLDSMQKDQTISALGQELVKLKLEIMTVKGGGM